jgi:hypothetical protein
MQQTVVTVLLPFASTASAAGGRLQPRNAEGTFCGAICDAVKFGLR